jgi:hypothetical protein
MVAQALIASFATQRQSYRQQRGDKNLHFFNAALASS